MRKAVFFPEPFFPSNTLIFPSFEISFRQLQCPFHWLPAKKGSLSAALPYSWMPGSSPGGMTFSDHSRTPRRAPTRIALHARAVPHQREMPAFAAHLAFVAFCLGFRPAFGLARLGRLRRTRLAPLHRFQLFRRRQIVLDFLLQRDGAFHRVA